MKTFDLTVVTPERISFEGQARSLSLPAWEGSMGVLAGHQSALVLLREGIVAIRAYDAEEALTISISGGFVEILPRKIVLFAETAELAQEVDEERARIALERARAMLKAGQARLEDVDIEKAQAALRRALVRLKVRERVSFKRKGQLEISQN